MPKMQVHTAKAHMFTPCDRNSNDCLGWIGGPLEENRMLQRSSKSRRPILRRQSVHLTIVLVDNAQGRPWPRENSSLHSETRGQDSHSTQCQP